MRIRTSAVALCAAALAAPALAPTAGAAEVAPGSPMRMDEYSEIAASLPESMPDEYKRSTCSQGVPGTVTLADGTQKDILVSAAHCVYGIQGISEAGDAVYLPTPEGDKVIGYADAGGPLVAEEEGATPLASFNQAFNSPDWGTVELEPGVSATRVVDSVDAQGHSHGDPVVLTGVRDYPDLGFWEISADNFGQPICKDGNTSGRSCGVQLFRTQNGLWSAGLNYDNGDSGGVNYDPQTGEALGVSSMAFGPIGRAQPIDRAIQDGYGIEDGQVNEHFALPDSTEAADATRTQYDDMQGAIAWYEENPEQAPEIPDPFDMLAEQLQTSLDEALGGLF
ncbi:hypothetical protein H7347_04105 [Corynebacterium sp. zg-331]|uniref:hypothetical protein n=1 Tax=unclassified Corynebacterium TaxID=2624378 RepID=UPI00128B7242|nr:MULTISPECIES: hypothetical protein [unclassified Corynebacterium]MBC3185762.1 hypothetical protein [Corynebacterium sp. zg-331]MPV52255.1 hypothetical protein [Corynebacterium sp. zg331]